MSSREDYQAARAEATDYLAEADLHLARTGRLPSIPLPADTLRALLAGPPEPSVEEVATLIDDAFSEHGFGAPFFAAQAVQALYRSKGAPQPDE